MAEQGQRRKLAAILSADVVGYSKLMADDEAATVATLKDYRAAVGRVIEQREGRVVNAPGDNILAEFPSAVEAVRAAVEIQRSIEGRNAEIDDDRRMRLRVGVNLGDVIEETDGTIYGDGVNIAARMEALADAGGICIASTVYDAVEGKLDFGFDFLGAQQVKNVAKPINVYRVRAEPGVKPAKLTANRTRKLSLVTAIGALVIAIVGGAIWQLVPVPVADKNAETTVETDPILALPDGPAIAVLPFENASGDPEQDYFATGLTEDLIVRLSQFDGFFVIARNSTSQFKGQSIDVRKIGKMLGARFVIEGSVRRTEDNLRVSVRFLNAEDGTNLWAESFDRDASAVDLFAIQDEITAKVAGIIGDNFGMLNRADQAATISKAPERLSAYECFLKMLAYFDDIAPEKHLAVRTCAERAVETDPDYPEAWVTLGWNAMDEHRYGFNTRPDATDRMFYAFRRAVELDPNNQNARHGLAEAHFSVGEVDAFMVEAERAIALNPNNSTIVAVLGQFMVFSGKRERGMALWRKGVALNPNYPSVLNIGLTFYNYRNGDYEGALEAALKVDWESYVWTHLLRAAAYGQLGRIDEARESTAKLLELAPDFAETGWQELQIWNMTPEALEHYAEGLSKAGLDMRTEPPPQTN